MIKFKQQSWLRRKISLAASRSAEIAVGSADAADDLLWSTMHESVRLAARLHILTAACLPRSIVLADMLRAHGRAAKVMLGVRKQGNSIASHAWVEVDGRMVAEPENVGRDFTPW